MKAPYIFGTLLLSAYLVGCSKAPAQEVASSAWRVQGERLVAQDPHALAGLRTGEADSAHPGYAQVSGRLLWTDEATARVFTPFNGRIEHILVNPGQHVERNQPLLRLSSSDYGQAQAEARKADADLRMAQRQFDRAHDLLDAGVLARKDFEQSEADLRHAQAEAARTSARLRAAGDRRAEVDGTFTLLTPFAGTIVERSVNAGTEVRADAPNPLFVVTDPQRMTVQFDVPEALSIYLHDGQEIEFSISSQPGNKGRARITHIAPEVEPSSQTVRVRGVVANDNRALRGESFVEALIPLPASAEHPVLVPADALVLVGDQHYVFAQQGTSYQRIPVRIATLGNERVEIVGNVHAGEHIVVDGALYLEQLLESGGRV